MPRARRDLNPTKSSSSSDFHNRPTSSYRVDSDPYSPTILNIILFISCFPVGYREISVKILFDLTQVLPVKIPSFMFLLPKLIASQPDLWKYIDLYVKSL